MDVAIVGARRPTQIEGTAAIAQITLSASVEADRAVARVTDTGEGIPPEHLPHVCERFYRVDAARARRSGGSGLGLAICRSIVEAHGGSLAIASEVGQGTTVAVTLPRPASPTPAHDATTPAPAASATAGVPGEP